MARSKLTKKQQFLRQQLRLTLEKRRDTVPFIAPKPRLITQTEKRTSHK